MHKSIRHWDKKATPNYSNLKIRNSGMMWHNSIPVHVRRRWCTWRMSKTDKNSFPIIWQSFQLKLNPSFSRLHYKCKSNNFDRSFSYLSQLTSSTVMLILVLYQSKFWVVAIHWDKKKRTGFYLLNPKSFVFHLRGYKRACTSSGCIACFDDECARRKSTLSLHFWITWIICRHA